MRVAIGVAALGLVACARAEHDPEQTWPEWRTNDAGAPATAVASHEPSPPGPAAALPSGVVGLTPTERPVVERPRAFDADPFGAFPAHASVFHHLAHVFEAPRPGSRAVGYYRRGALLRASEEVGREGCERGWYAVWGGGFVCAGQGYKLHADAPVGDPDYPAPDGYGALPYAYVKVVTPAAQTWRLPAPQEDAALREGAQRAASLADERAEEVAGAVEAASVKRAAAAADAGVSVEELARPSWVRMWHAQGHYLSIAGESVREDGRVFLRTVRGAFVPKAATVPVEPPAAKGVRVADGLQRRIAFARRAGRRYRRDVRGQWKAEGSLEAGFAVTLSGETASHAGQALLGTLEGDFVVQARVGIASPRPRPALVPQGARWLHVDTAQQVLVAYEQDRPVFATLVSTGKEGFATPAGLHRIHAKHIATTMDDTTLIDGAYYIEDVPWTMYFLGSFALHAAFWHDRFGTARSHGCVNLAPADARWLFRFVHPALPEGRHGVLVPGETASYLWVEDS